MHVTAKLKFLHNPVQPSSSQSAKMLAANNMQLPYLEVSSQFHQYVHVQYGHMHADSMYIVEFLIQYSEFCAIQ